MQFSRVALFAFSLLPAITGVLAGDHIHPQHNHPAHLYKQPTLAKRQSRNFTLTDSMEGASFFDKWTFMTFDDPTHGLVNYVDRDTAFNLGLAYVREDGVAVMKVDNTTSLQSGEKRNSVRIHTSKGYGQGLFIVDIAQMPYGCSVWPAFWSNGDNWPAGGEIDIIEGTQNSTINQSTLHTTPGCQLDTTKQASAEGTPDSFASFTGEVATTICDSNVDFNSGCGIRYTSTKSYGIGLNGAGGAVYATLWNEEGIRVWHFARADVPEDITSQTPNPDAWGPPVAFFSSDSCPMSQFFTDQSFIFNITLCGDLAGGAANFIGAGCPGTCQDFVMDPNNFRYAMWKVNYFRVYN